MVGKEEAPARAAALESRCGDAGAATGLGARRPLYPRREVRRRIERRREVAECGRRFAAMEKARDRTEQEEFEHDAALWCNSQQGEMLAPMEAVRLPRLVRQPKRWVREILDMVRDGGA